MINNNIISFLFHIVISVINIFLYFIIIFNDYDNLAIISFGFVLIILPLYFILGYHLETQESKLENMLSFSFISAIGLTLWIIFGLTGLWFGYLLYVPTVGGIFATGTNDEIYANVVRFGFFWPFVYTFILWAGLEWKKLRQAKKVL